MAKTRKPTEKIRVNSFFAGIGGFELAFERQGFLPAFYCENNDFCRNVLKRHWPTTTNASDICELDARDIPEAVVWTAGFPCQDLSLARTPHGERSGLRGSRSGLFYKFLELLEVHTPKVVLLENVSGLLNSHSGADFNTLVSSLTELGYAVSWRVFNARYFGVPQSRPRVFVCAWHGSLENAARVLFEDAITAKPKNERLGFLTESKCHESGISVPQISFCISATSGRHTGLDWARSYVTYPNAVRRLTPLECERLQGFPENWTIPDNDYVIPIRGIETSRYHAVGNAVCVPVAEWIAGRIADNLQREQQKKEYCDKFIDAALKDIASRLVTRQFEVQNFRVTRNKYKWKSGGIAFQDSFVTDSVSPSPSAPLVSQLFDVIEKKQVHQRYFLSANAAQGILRRVDKLGRNLFPPLDSVLRMIAAPEHINSDAKENSYNKEYVTL